MSHLTEQFLKYQKLIQSQHASLLPVSKTKPAEAILELYQLGNKTFAENYVQELVSKQAQLPKDIEWHFIGHLQSNKVKYLAPFVACIQSVDSLKLLREINKEAKKNRRVINCLLQLYVAKEESKFGFSEAEANSVFSSEVLDNLSNIMLIGVMGMASFTENKSQIRKEFRLLKSFYDDIKNRIDHPNVKFNTLSMGMSGDFEIALQEGSTLIRIGSAIFGTRN